MIYICELKAHSLHTLIFVQQVMIMFVLFKLDALVTDFATKTIILRAHATLVNAPSSELAPTDALYGLSHP